MGNPEIFAVISWGAAATTWVAKVLNSHPDIFCVHHLRKDLRQFIKFDTPFDALNYMRFIERVGFFYKASGDIHGVEKEHIPMLKKNFGSRFNTAVIVREPLPRIRSAVAVYKNYSPERHSFSHIENLIKIYNIPLPDNNPLNKWFIHFCSMLNSICEEYKIGKVYRSEDITSNPEILKDFICNITNEKVPLEDSWLQKATATEKIYQRASADDSFYTDDWHIDVYKKIVSPQAWELYCKLGYNLPKFISL